MANVFPGGNYKSEPFNLTDTNRTVVYTCPAGATVAYVEQIWVADDAGAARTVTVEWTTAAPVATYVLAYQRAISANTELKIDLGPLAIDPSDTIKLTASAAGVHGFVTVQEIGR